ncbi:mrna capping enzyme [Vairimorpha apis BRL 01]|uniref:mRNA-capping enzyme subunit beta n=1 Tax=Vairimorpha apis BRL 01 TaxID=1037528 RepID=T0MBM0_9MICR|nr:mrna capping enzyme [Vairimorpha apis BRL 01]
MLNTPQFLLNSYDTDYESILKQILLLHSNIKYEIEARIGKIYNKETDSRIKINSLVPIIFKKLPKMNVFVPGVDQWDFKNLQKNLTLKDHLEDSFKYYKNGNRVRYVNGEYRFCEKKSKILVLDVYMPAYKYDIRISVMTEEKQMQRITQSSLDFIRYRDRYTYSFKQFNCDFTTVRKNNEISFEVEIEVDDFNYSVEDFIECFYKMNICK